MFFFSQKKFYIVVISWLLISCQAKVNESAPTYDIGSTIPIAGTESVQAQSTVPISALTLTFTPFPIASPFPPEIASLLGTKCMRFDETVHNQFISLYGDKGCKLPVLSPDGKHLAYVTLIRQEKGTSIYFVDAVKIIKVGTNENDKEVYIAHSMDYIGALEWSMTGQLIIWEYVWEGPGVISIYDPVKDMILVRARTGKGDDLHWNLQKSAFYTTHRGEYGADVCVKEIGGYDFLSDKPFPDLYKVFNIEESKNDPFEIPHGERDNLYIEPFSWSQDGKQLWLTITPLYWNGDQAYEYKVGPRQAGVLEFSATRIAYKSLATNPFFNYSFDGYPDPKILSNSYRPQTCP